MILKNVSELVKGKTVVSVSEAETISVACKKMADTNERAIAVKNNEELVGILSDKDVVYKLVAKDMDPNATTVSDIMTPSPATISATDTVAHAIDIMANGHFHHLPILNGNNFIGMIYSDDIPEEYKLLLEHYKELKG